MMMITFKQNFFFFFSTSTTITYLLFLLLLLLLFILPFFLFPFLLNSSPPSAGPPPSPLSPSPSSSPSSHFLSSLSPPPPLQPIIFISADRHCYDSGRSMDTLLRRRIPFIPGKYQILDYRWTHDWHWWSGHFGMRMRLLWHHKGTPVSAYNGKNMHYYWDSCGIEVEGETRVVVSSFFLLQEVSI